MHIFFLSVQKLGDNIAKAARIKIYKFFSRKTFSFYKKPEPKPLFQDLSAYWLVQSPFICSKKSRTQIAVNLPVTTEVHGSSRSARRTVVSCRPSASRTQALSASRHAGAGQRCYGTLRQNIGSASTVETLAAGRHHRRQVGRVQSIAHAQFNSLFVAQRSTRTEIIQFQWPCCLLFVYKETVDCCFLGAESTAPFYVALAKGIA